MPAPFQRTLRSLPGDGSAPIWVGIVAALLLAGWLAWFVLSPVAVYAATDHARIEAGRDVHPVQALVAGRLIGCRDLLGASVRAGEVLCELEAVAEQSRLTEERTRRAALLRQVALARAEIQGGRRALAQDQNARLAAIEEANAASREAQATARRSDDALARLGSLQGGAKMSDLDLVRLKSEADGHRATAEGRQHFARRLELERSAAESDRRVALQRLERELDDLMAQLASAEASIQLLTQQAERHLLRAPVAGRVGEVAPLRPGAFVTPGERLAVVVPDGGLRIVADYDPAAAVGRIRAGQPARFRLAGFPSSQYGTLGARVLTVAMEPRDGRIRVELGLAPGAAYPVALRHGLPGRAEVQLERVSPATLVLRAAGRLVTRQKAGREDS